MKSMQKCTWLLALILGTAIVGTAHGAGGNRHLLASASAATSAKSDSNNPEADASASASAFSEGGVASAHAYASTEVIEEINAIIVKIYNEAFLQIVNKTCEEIIVIAEAEVTAEASAIASVYATTIGEVSVEGQGEACIDAYASGEAEAKTFAEAVASAIVQQLFLNSTGDSSATATADALADVVSAGAAKAFAEAYASGCTTGGYGVAEQNSFAGAIIQPVAHAFARAIGGPACPQGTEARAFVEGSSDAKESVEAFTDSLAESIGTTDIQVEGDARAETRRVDDQDEINQIIADNLERCRGVYSTCCRISNKRKDSCDCSRSIMFPKPQCDMRKHSYNPVIWESVEKEINHRCKC